MSVQSRQALRLMKFVAEMKKNNFPNATSFAKLLRRADVDENFACACSTRTIMRDIETLQKDYHAPIDYDAARRGYYLRIPDWEFSVPIMSDDILSMTLLGTKLASDILPEPIKTDVNTAVEKVLTGNKSEFFDEAMIESLLCATGIKAAVDPVIFKKIFDGWRLHQVVAITYNKPNGGESQRKFEPHIIAFYHGIWYAKGYEYGTKDVKSYAIQRITSVAFGIDTFETDKKLLEQTRRNGLFEYPKIDGVRLRCDASIAFYLYEHQKAKKFKIERQDDGSLIITLKPAFQHDVIRWVLGESGKIEVLEPPELREKVAAAGKKIWERNRDLLFHVTHAEGRKFDMIIIYPGYSLVFEGVTENENFKQAVSELVKTSRDIQNTNIPAGKDALISWNEEDEEDILSFNADLDGYQFHKRVGLFDSLLESGLCNRFIFVFSPGEDIEIEIVISEKTSGVVRHWFQSCSIDEITENSAEDFDDPDEFKHEWEYDPEPIISQYIQDLVESFDPTALSIWEEMK